MALSPADEAKLKGVHPDLVKVVRFAAQHCSFRVVEGLRTVARQKQLVATGKSKTMNSRHITGHAVDLVPLVGGQVSWDWKDFWPMVAQVENAGKAVGVPIEAGAHWKSFPDGPHFQLPFASYPK